MSKIHQADRLITVRETLLLLGIGSTTLYKFCRQGKLNPVKFSTRCTRFRMSEINAFIDNAQKGGAK